jgi:hypothetical protein
MGDKFAAFVIGQNFLWTYAALKGDLERWIASRRKWFVGGAIGAGIIYALIEAFLWWRAGELIHVSGYVYKIQQQILGASVLVFSMRALGAFGSSAVAAWAFWGTTREAENR